MANIFITGGSGSLGSALIRHLCDTDDVTVYSRDEWKQSELRREFPDVRFVLGDVRDMDRLLMAMRGQEFVVHAAAYKQVPSAEANVDEAIHTNVMGSLNVARAAVLNGVGCVIGISTDKACEPINAYGQTKALMEKLFQQADDWGDTIFNCVRYGNVLGSRGSVVPLFLRQLAEGKKYTITDPAMTRFWLTMPEAVSLITSVLDDDEGIQSGAIIVPACPASDMLTLLHAVHRLYGNDDGPLTAEHFDVIGMRPGEKLHERLIHWNESEHTLPPGDYPHYQILPSDTDVRHEPFIYTSDTAVQLQAEALVNMLHGPDDVE